MTANDWDVIVIGSGLGGLTAGAYLSALGQRTLVLEKHYLAGGNASVFRRLHKFEFDVGVHYLAECGPGAAIPRILGGLGLDERIEFLELDPEGFDTIVVPGATVKVPYGWENYRRNLVEAFPDDESALHRCLDILEAVIREGQAVRALENPNDFARVVEVAPTLVRWGMRPVTELFDHCELGARPRAVLLAQGPAYATPPSRTAVVLEAGFLDGYLKGAHYPRGGGQVIAANLVEALRATGGEIRLRTGVQKILVEDGAVTGVCLADGEVLRAPVVISNGDLKRTMLDLVGREHVSAATAERIGGYRMALPFFVVYLGLDIDLRERWPRTNYWLSESLDIEGIYQQTFSGEVPEKLLLLITAGSVKDPGTHTLAPVGCTALQAMTLVPPGHALWHVAEGPVAGERYHRNRDYRSLKDEFTERVVDAVSAVIPDLREHIVWKEASTPITHERYTSSTGGTSYGIELALDQLGPNRPGAKTEIDGLYLTGASTGTGHGISGVIKGGIATASTVAGRDLMAEVRSGTRFVDPARLPAHGPQWDPWEASRISD
ncbi:MAG: NAD(P)/FAD-dependent oxidoreductase [Dehalococcoidia bacterium]|nr:NAD(P)/FAD-dependent oxidoreductase [Dehalococcoidia bacterium]NUQ54821.1 NAD(P)/FAD-dependent oxidoreductase [Dehalococcoidia bacterium]